MRGKRASLACGVLEASFLDSRSGLKLGLLFEELISRTLRWIGYYSVTMAVSGAGMIKLLGTQLGYRKGHKAFVFSLPLMWFEGYVSFSESREWEKITLRSKFLVYLA